MIEAKQAGRGFYGKTAKTLPLRAVIEEVVSGMVY
jgi:hypothetical protein